MNFYIIKIYLAFRLMLLTIVLVIFSSSFSFAFLNKDSCSYFVGSSDEVSELTCLVDLFDDDIECEIMIELLRCVISFSQQLGKTASSIFYESLLTAPDISSEDIVQCIVKILQTGSSTSGDHAIVLQKELTNHKSYRKLSVDMFLSLQGLYRKASSWDKILNVIEGFLKFLVPQKIMLKFDSEMSLNINSSIIVHSAYQIAKVMFESAWDFLLLLSYLVDISGQVSLCTFLCIYILMCNGYFSLLASVNWKYCVIKSDSNRKLNIILSTFLV